MDQKSTEYPVTWAEATPWNRARAIAMFLIGVVLVPIAIPVAIVVSIWRTITGYDEEAVKRAKRDQEAIRFAMLERARAIEKHRDSVTDNLSGEQDGLERLLILDALALLLRDRAEGRK